ncbi:MAG: dTDP-4-dehydrorhamnose 3,5-epimerase [Bacteroidetes bacterium]|nr:dTDP-4-dehydrorhamnose 3,5-epimerase [Bacteroidota bacterium]
MQLIDTPISGLFVVQPRVIEDARGYFFESFSASVFKNIGIEANFVQDNQSLSNKGVLRGLHFQNPPHAQGKLVRVIKGAVLDLAVDIRKDSATYGKHYAIELNEQNKTMLWIPEGFAHGFLTLTDNTIFFYKCTNFYNKASEDCIKWDDSTLNINWGLSNPIISEKDQQGKPFNTFQTLF